MDGRLGNDADGSWPDAIPGASKGRSDEPGGGPSGHKEDHHDCMQFLIEDVICRYGCVGKIVADQGELDAEEAEELFDRLGMRLSLRMP